MNYVGDVRSVTDFICKRSWSSKGIPEYIKHFTGQIIATIHRRFTVTPNCGLVRESHKKNPWSFRFRNYKKFCPHSFIAIISTVLAMARVSQQGSNSHPESVNKNITTRWAPKTSYKWSEITPISRVFSPESPIYFRPFLGAPFHSAYNCFLGGSTLIRRGGWCGRNR